MTPIHMKIVFFTHPAFLSSQSMPRFAKMLIDGMRVRGHDVKVWNPAAFFYKMPFPGVLKKWLGYVDQYVVFPQMIKKALRKQSKDVLFVFCDNALGPWVPMVADRPHVIHCHDFLAQKSASGLIPENLTSWTGIKYQEFIRNGYKKGKSFISVSEATKKDLELFINSHPLVSEVVYNGISPLFKPIDKNTARSYVQKSTGINCENGFLLHVGGNQWYKNRVGVIEIFNAWKTKYPSTTPLFLIGANPSLFLMLQYEASPFRKEIFVLTGLSDEEVQMAYSAATLFIFPSIAEGFGWPIAEAMASGTMVVTTNEAPMTEVAGDSAFLISRKPNNGDVSNWANDCADQINLVMELSEEQQQAVIQKGLVHVKKFNSNDSLDRIEKIYQSILESSL